MFVEGGIGRSSGFAMVKVPIVVSPPHVSLYFAGAGSTYETGSLGWIGSKFLSTWKIMGFYGF